MKTENIVKIKSLKTRSKILKSFHSDYEEKTEDPDCDKHNIGFKLGQSDRFNVFNVPVTFECYTGYYGSSSCSTFRAMESKEIQPYFVKVLNKLQKEIFQMMAKEMERDSSELKEAAYKEVEELKKLIEGV